MNAFSLQDRVRAAEKLDELHHDPEELRVNLAHLAGVNRWLGGERSVMSHLRRDVRRATRSFSLLDVGTGGADLPSNISKYVARHSLEAVVFALDRQRSVADIAAERTRGIPHLNVVVGDGIALPLPDNSVDVAISSTTLHHLSTDDSITCVREMSRVARLRVIVSDLNRNAIALAGANLLARTWWRRSVYRFDGPLSVRKAFTRSELLSVGEEAGLRSPRVYRHFPFRLVLVGTPH